MNKSASAFNVGTSEMPLFHPTDSTTVGKPIGDCARKQCFIAILATWPFYCTKTKLH